MKLTKLLTKRFDSSKTAFILVGQADTGEIGPMNWLRKMSAKIFRKY